MSEQETWADNGGSPVVLNYDERGICEVDREAMRIILERAGFTQADVPTDLIAERMRTAKVKALREAAYDLAFRTDGIRGRADAVHWLRDRADRIAGDDA